MHFFALSGILACLFSLTFGIFSWVKGKKFFNKLFAILNFAIAIWGLGAYKFSLSPTESQTLFWLRIGHVGAILIPPLFIHFIFEFLEVRKKKALILIYLTGAVFFISNITDWFGLTKIFIINLRYVFGSFYVDSPPGLLYPFFVAYFLGVAIYAHYIGLDCLRLSTGIRRMQLKYFLVASALAFGGGATAFLMVFRIDIYPYAHIAIALYPIIMTYAIFRYRLMDIRLALSRFATFSLVASLIFWLLVAVGHRMYNGWGAWLALVAMAVILTALGGYTYIFLQRKAEDRLFRNQRRYQHTLLHASEGMALIKDFDKLLKLIVLVLTRTIGVTWAGVYLLDAQKSAYVLRGKRGEASGSIQQSIKADNPLVKKLLKEKTALVYDEIRLQNYPATPELAEIEANMFDVQASIIVPSFAIDKLLGFTVLGNKLSKEIYTQEDINVFTVLANQAGIAIENIMFTDQLKQAQARLFEAEKLASLGRLGAGMAHDINNPVNIIRMKAETLLLSGEARDAKIKEGLEMTMKQCDRIGGMIDEILKYSKAPNKIEVIDLNKLIDDSIHYVHLEQNMGKVTVYKKLDTATLQVEGNPGRLERVFSNLIRNAVESMNHEGDLHIESKSSEKKAIVTIKDTGKGIDAEALSKIFEPFYSTRSEGTGLGLFICSETIKNHNGAIDVESEPGKGTTFTVKLPTHRRKD